MSTKCLDYDDFRDAEGGIDFRALGAARVQNGESCRKCGGIITFPDGRPVDCYDCKALQVDVVEVRHDSYIRCPKCRHSFSADDALEGHQYEDGEHDVDCPECDHEFEFSTYVSFSFKSPALLEDGGS